MGTHNFLVFMLVLLVALVSFHSAVKEKLSPHRRLQRQVKELKREREALELRTHIVSSELADFQQHVATLIPKAMEGKKDYETYELRKIASLVGARDEIVGIERASGLFEKAKEAFRQKVYEESNPLFQQLLEKFPDSVHVIESHFLLAEGQFQLRETEAAVETIEKMLTLYPQSELTGFGLLRLGMIYEKQERLEDAADIYRAIMANFKAPELIKQAKLSLRGVDL